MERVTIYIDGANFYHGVRSIDRRYTDFKFDFEKFCNKLANKRKLVKVKYYNAPLKFQLNPEICKQQQRLFSRLSKNPLFEINLVKRQKVSQDGNPEQHKIKGDDIKLAIDMVDDAHQNKFDVAVLISGDGDFVPLVDKIRELGKKIENVHFPKSISYNLLHLCDSNIPITKKILKKHFYREIEKLTLVDTLAGKNITLQLDENKNNI